MTRELQEKIKKTAIIAMFSDDEFLESLVLKGGNVIDLFFNISHRASIDLDFSIEHDFKEKDFNTLETKLKNILYNTFLEENLIVFDIIMRQKPRKSKFKQKDFWGGYELEFKVISGKLYNSAKQDIDSLRRQAMVIGPNQRKKFKIDISKHEYCNGKKEQELDGYIIYIYSPEMLVFEKLRALCQQTEKYQKIVNSMQKRARARDFFDIYIIMKEIYIDIESFENKELLKNIFKAKRVPLNLIGEIRKDKEFHKKDFDSVKATVYPNIKLEKFEFYFNYVLDKFEGIKF